MTALIGKRMDGPPMAALSSEHMLLNLGVERCYREWLHNISRAMDANGALPGVIPTGGWGFFWGNGPAWDNVLFYLTYFTYRYRGRPNRNHGKRRCHDALPALYWDPY